MPNSSHLFLKKTISEALRAAYEERRAKNRRYSLRAFARDLAIPSSRLNEVMNRKSGIRQSRAKEIAEKLYTDKHHIDFFVTLSQAEFGQTKSIRNAAKLKLKTFSLLKSHFSNYADRLSFFTDWRNLALFEYAKLEDFNGSLLWLEQKTGFPRDFIKDSLLKMRDYKVVEFHKITTGIKVIRENLMHDFKVPNPDIRRFYSSVMDESKRVLAEPKPNIDDFFATIFLPTNPAQQKILRKKLIDFLFEFTETQDKSPANSKVNCLAVQFFGIGKPDM